MNGMLSRDEAMIKNLDEVYSGRMRPGSLNLPATLAPSVTRRVYDLRRDVVYVAFEREGVVEICGSLLDDGSYFWIPKVLSPLSVAPQALAAGWRRTVNSHVWARTSAVRFEEDPW